MVRIHRLIVAVLLLMAAFCLTEKQAAAGIFRHSRHCRQAHGHWYAGRYLATHQPVRTVAKAAVVVPARVVRAAVVLPAKVIAAPIKAVQRARCENGQCRKH